MLDAASRFDAAAGRLAEPASRDVADSAAGVGYDGRLEAHFATEAGRTVTRRLYQSAPCRALFPGSPADAPRHVVQVNIAGGLVGGDCIATTLSADRGARVFATTQAAEKVYRTRGAAVTIETKVSAAPDAWLEWMPQPTILFDAAALRRELEIDTARGSTVLAGEMLILGRTAHGESLSCGTLEDHWSVLQDGRPLWRERTYVDDWSAAIGDRARFGGARATAVLLYHGADLARCLEAVRSVGGLEGGRFGATLLDGLLLARWLGPDAEAVLTARRKAWGVIRHTVAGYSEQWPPIWRS